MAQSNRFETRLCQALNADHQLNSPTPGNITQNPNPGEIVAAPAARGANTNIGRVEPAETPRLKSSGRTTELHLRNRVVKTTKAKNIEKLFKIGKFRFICGTNLILRNGEKVTRRRFPNRWEKFEQPEEPEETSKIGRFRFTPGSTLRYKKGDKVTDRRFPAKWEKGLPRE